MLIKNEDENNSQIDKSLFESNIKNILKTYSELASKTTENDLNYDEQLNQLNEKLVRQQQQLFGCNTDNYSDDNLQHQMGDDYYS